MKKLLLQVLLIASALTGKAQIMMTLGDNKYNIAEVDSIVFTHVDLPSATTMMEQSGQYGIFVEALRLTGIADSLMATEKVREYTMSNHTDRYGNSLYYPTTCDLGFTVFAEKDDVLRAAGINSVADLIAKCKEWYGNPSWYDLIAEQGVNISTGSDYTNEWNVLHMFVAYHIIPAKIAVDELVYERNSKNDNWNYCFGYEPQAYYETMLQGTMLKVWQTNPKTQKELWLNRYVKNNTLTDQYATFGSDAIHPLLYRGAQIDREASLETMNASIHSIDKVLLYDQNARDSQHERMRFHVNQMLPELATNKIMRASNFEISMLNGGGDGSRLALPTDYFDHLHCYQPDMVLRYCVCGAWRALESTQLQGWDDYDFAIRLPRVPSGRYEVRTMYAPMSIGALMEFYISSDSTLANMQKLSTLDVMQDPSEADFGYVAIVGDNYWGDEEPADKYGIEAGKTMRKNGYMYAPASFSRGMYNTITDPLTVTEDDPYAACRQMVGSTSCRTESGYGIMQLRYIIGTVDMKQGQDCWLRIKGTQPADFDGQKMWNLNFIELVPTDVADNDTLMEDWY